VHMQACIAAASSPLCEHLVPACTSAHFIIVAARYNIAEMKNVRPAIYSQQKLPASGKLLIFAVVGVIMPSLHQLRHC